MESIRHLESEIILETEQADTSGLYHHTVTIKIGDITIDNEELDCEFDIPFLMMIQKLMRQKLLFTIFQTRRSRT